MWTWKRNEKKRVKWRNSERENEERRKYDRNDMDIRIEKGRRKNGRYIYNVRMENYLGLVREGMKQSGEEIRIKEEGREMKSIGE